MHDRALFATSLLVLLWTSPSGAAEILVTIPNPLVGTDDFGRAVANVGDQNGDGFDDFVVGSDGFSGHALLYYGGSALDGQYDLVIPPNGYSLRLGYSVTGLGDFNADGYEDFAVGQPGSNGTVWAQVRVFFGGPGLDGDADLLLVGPSETSGMGWAVSGGRDLNGDGHPDLVAAARFDDTGTALQGRVYVYFGGPSLDDQADLLLDGLPGDYGFGTDVELVEDVTGDGHDDLVVMVGFPGRAVAYAGGPALDAAPDWSVEVGSGWAAAGDVDGDGSADIVLGFPAVDAVHVYRGGPSLDPVVDLVLEGRQPGERFGRMVEMPGDVDGDGSVDLVVGAAGTGNNQDRGLMYVYRGADPADPQLELVMAPSESDRRFGYAAASIGDIDGDGAEELVVGGLDYVWVVDELFFDCDDDDRSDLQQVIDGELEDCDQDGVPDLCQLALWIEEDCDQSGLPDACDIAADPDLDCDQNGKIDACEIAADPPSDPALDCDGNGVLDSCQLLSSPEDDCDGDGQIDVCAITADPTLDCDGEGTVDSCQLLAFPEIDCDADGQIDVCTITADPTVDCDADGEIDACQLLAAPELDCDGDGEIDVCTITADPSVDCDYNGQLDVCDIATIEDWDRDCDADGEYDRCEITSSPSKDADTDGILDACQLPGEFALYADADHTTHNLTVSASGIAGPFELVLHAPAGTSAVRGLELFVSTSAGIAITTLELAAGSLDADGSAGGVVAVLPDLAPDPDGEVLLARLWCYVGSPAVVDQELRIETNTSPFHDPDFGLPLWVDDADAAHVVSTTRSGWINRSFADCNANGRPDDEDISFGYSSDVNLNGIPDECEVTSTPPAEVSWDLAIAGHPNPFNPAATLRLTLPRAGAARVEIVDLLGRRVRGFEIAADAPGPREIVWRGTDDGGHPVASGVYIARLVQGGRAAQGKLVLLR